jgi:hypothetical protein
MDDIKGGKQKDTTSMFKKAKAVLEDDPECIYLFINLNINPFNASKSS